MNAEVNDRQTDAQTETDRPRKKENFKSAVSIVSNAVDIYANNRQLKLTRLRHRYHAHNIIRDGIGTRRRRFVNSRCR